MPSEHNVRVIAEFRAGGGTVGGYYAPIPLILLTTIGARSGRPHTAPLAYVNDGPGRLVAYASNRGAHKHPDWYHNLVVNPDVSVEVGTRRLSARAAVATGAERERLLKELISKLSPVSDMVDHQERTGRQIPVVVLRLAPVPGEELDSSSSGDPG
jgi:deazaflavin-dependent oxidoreductase (nitroreductase family)